MVIAIDLHVCNKIVKKPPLVIYVENNTGDQAAYYISRIFATEIPLH